MNWDKVWTINNWERLLFGDLFSKGQVGGLLLTLELRSPYARLLALDGFQ